MAHRQLSSLVRRIRRPLLVSAPIHGRTFQHFVEVQQCVAEDFSFYKWNVQLGSRFFSGASSQKRPGGKVINSAEKVVSSQGQSSGGGASLGAERAAQNEAESTPEQSPSSSFLVVGAFSALVIALLAFFPWDLLKGYYVGERKDSEVLHEDLKQIDHKGIELPSNQELEAEKKNYDMNNTAHLPVVKNPESSKEVFEPQMETPNGERLLSQNNDQGKSSTGSVSPAETESILIKNVSSADYVREKVSAVFSEEPKASEAELKDKVSQLNGRLSGKSQEEDPFSPSLPGDFKDDQSLAPSGKGDKVLPFLHQEKESLEKDSVDNKEPSQATLSSPKRRPSLLGVYYLDTSSTNTQDNGQIVDRAEDLTAISHEGREKVGKVKEEDSVKLHTDSAQNVFDLLELVHAAEIRQAELDAHLYEEAQRRLKQAFQRELKDAQAKELMYAEEASRLAKEIEHEKEKAAAALELEQKMAREKHLEELKHKEEETDLKLKKAELLSKTERAAAVAEEKLSYIKDVRNIKQELEALYMALSTQSEEFHQSHSIHKLAVGTFALEDAMKRGAPVDKEVTLISSSYKDADPDPLLDAVISTLPEEAVKRGTMTPSQLQQKFETLKNGVIELSLLPSTGGGLISHAAAKVVSAIKVKESGRYSDGVAAVVSQVQKFLADGKLADAADLLERGVQGTEAEILVADWIKSARDRAVMEQMLLLLQAHATAAASSLA